MRTDEAGRVAGYVLGDGRSLEFDGRSLASSALPWSVSADGKRVFASGMRRARENLPALAAEGRCWLPAPQAQLYADGEPVEAYVDQGQMAVVEPKGRD